MEKYKRVVMFICYGEFMGILKFLRRNKKSLDKAEFSDMDNNLPQGFEPRLNPATQLRNISQFQSLPEDNYDRNFQLVLAKLELVLTRLQNLEQKIALIEQIAKESQEQDQKWTQRKIY